jgi:ketosteroid isomerase-like protein
MLNAVLAAVVLASALVVDSASTRTLEHAQRQLAVSMQRNGPVEGFVPFLAPDVAYLHPGVEIITGRDATRAFLESTYANVRAPRTMLHSWTTGASADERVGYSFGWLEETSVAAGGGITRRFGRFVAAWRKQEGSWRVHAFLRITSGGPPDPPPPDALILDGAPGLVQPGLPAAHQLEIMIADSRFADLSIAQGYSLAFPAYAADAAVLVTGGNAFWNREGVEIAMAGWVPSQTLSWYPLRSEAAVSGDLGWSIGHGTFADESNGFRSYSKYLTLWIRTSSGWRWLLDAGNSRPAPRSP